MSLINNLFPHDIDDDADAADDIAIARIRHLSVPGPFQAGTMLPQSSRPLREKVQTVKLRHRVPHWSLKPSQTRGSGFKARTVVHVLYCLVAFSSLL